jgi:hypothetical protein
VIYTPVPVLVVALYSKGRPRGFLSVSSSLLLDSQEDRVFAEKVMPRLKAYYMQDLMSLSNTYFNVKYPIDSNMISKVLQKATNRALKHNRAKFYILNVSVQKKR